MNADPLPDDCGCCAGIAPGVPEPVENRPGLDQVRYRVGTHRTFLAGALAALSDPRFAALRGLTTRAPDDFTVALLDGWATVADVLTFYQERIAHEHWLRTATERESVLRLARLIGYRPKPGVAAETPLSFTLDETPGAPTRVTVAPGTRVQSVPGAGELPQTFETIEPLEARVEWNALRPAQTAPPAILPGVTSLHLRGAATNLQPGDAILIVGDERAASGSLYPARERWDFRLLRTVTPDVMNDRTAVTWDTGLGEAPILPAAANVKVYAFRLRAARFGHNALDPAMVTAPGGGAVGTWPGFNDLGSPVDLDNAYPKIVAGSWMVLVNSAGYVELYRVASVTFPSRAAFGLSGKVTRVVPDVTGNLTLFGRRETIVYAQSEALEMTAGPLLAPAPGALAETLAREPGLLAPIEGATVALDRRIPPLPAGRKVIITGKPVRVRVAAAAVTLVAPDGLQTVTVARGTSLILTARPTLLPGKQARWELRTDDGFEGRATTGRGDLVLSAARDADATWSERAVVQSCAGGEPSVLTLENPPLARLYDRATVTIAANVADATHGETVAETLGGGDAAQGNQRFVLRQTPLTFVRSPAAPGGAASTLEIRVDNLRWHEVPTLSSAGRASGFSPRRARTTAR